MSSEPAGVRIPSSVLPWLSFLGAAAAALVAFGRQTEAREGADSKLAASDQVLAERIAKHEERDSKLEREMGELAGAARARADELQRQVHTVEVRTSTLELRATNVESALSRIEGKVDALPDTLSKRGGR